MSLCRNIRHLINLPVTALIFSFGDVVLAQFDDYQTVNYLVSRMTMVAPQQQSVINTQLALYKYDDAQLLVGQIAQQVVSYNAVGGASYDFENTRMVIADTLFKCGLVKKLRSFHLNKQGEPILNT